MNSPHRSQSSSAFQNPQNPQNSSAFTLIELLIVIAIIAIIAGLSFPAFQAAILRANIAEATNKARQIGIALHVYADDHDGNYPAGRNSYEQEIHTSNDAFRGLFPDYLDSEQVFVVGRSKLGAKADDNIASPSAILKPGENHWAYVEGLSTSSKSTWPLLVDHTDGSGTYSNVDTEVGGTWKGVSAIIVRADTSSSAVPLKGLGKKRFIPRRGDESKNALVLADYMGSGARLLEPARATTPGH